MMTPQQKIRILKTQVVEAQEYAAEKKLKLDGLQTENDLIKGALVASEVGRFCFCLGQLHTRGVGKGLIEKIFALRKGEF